MFTDLQKLITYLTKNHLMIVTAESITGGELAKTFTDIAGSSEWFSSGVVSYSDRIKNKVLGVKKETLQKYTAVSKECALEMASGVLKLMNADIALSTTGYAGPTGESVGKVFIGLATKAGLLKVKEMEYSPTLSRLEIRDKVVSDAISFTLSAH